MQLFLRFTILSLMAMVIVCLNNGRCAIAAKEEEVEIVESTWHKPKHHPKKKTTTTTTTEEPTQPELTPPTTRRRKTTTTPLPEPTTPLPEPTTPLPEPPVTPSDFCQSCASRRNQKDLYANPDDCHTYFQCFYINETFAVGFLRSCPPNMFFSDQILQCLPETTTPCADPCQDDAVAATGCYGPSDNCAQFFICANGYSAPFCCPPLTRFDQTSCGCISDETCIDTCSLPTVAPTVVAPPTSNGTFCTDSFGVTLSAAASPDQYVIWDTTDPSNPISYTMPCAPGSQFDLTACRCDVEVETVLSPLGRQCNLYLPFDTDLEDHSVEQFLTYLFGDGNLDTAVSAIGAGSFFVSGGRLEIPGLKTFDFQRAASFCLFFRCGNGPATSPYTCPGNAGIFSNNNNASMTDYSVIMATQGVNTFTGRVRFWHPSGSATVSSPVNTPTPGWNQVCITYDGLAVTLYLNGAVVDTEAGSGAIAIGHCPYVVGTDQVFGDFTGHIDEVLACPFTMTQEEVTAHFQGNKAFLVSEGLIPA